MFGFFSRNSRTFHEHVNNLQRVIHPNHKAVRVPKVGHSKLTIGCNKAGVYFFVRSNASHV